MMMRLDKLVNSFINITKSRFLKVKILLSVAFYITYRCNFRCKYCNVQNIEEKEMTNDQIFQMIDELGKAGTQRFGFTGGEPLLRENIESLINHCKRRKMITTLCTNGWLVPERINDLKKLDILVISFDGPENIHDKYRKKGSYKKVIEAIKIARQEKIKVWTSTVLTKDNIHYMDFILEKANELDFQVGFQPVYNYSLSTNVESFLPSVEDFKKIVGKLIERKKSGAPLIYSLSFLEYLYKTWPLYDHNVLKCLAGKFFCVISPRGDIYPCQPMQVGIKSLNGLKVGFKNAFEGIHNFSCNGCFCDSFIESNFLFSFDINAIYNALHSF